MGKSGPRFGTDGIRGVANSELTPELLVALGRALVEVGSPGTVMVGRDTRRSGSMLVAALAAGITSAGADVVDAGVITTPGLAWLAAGHGCMAAMVSASHNPFSDNGVKVFAAGGTKLAAETEEALQAALDRQSAAAVPGAPGTGVGRHSVDPDLIDAYLAHLVATTGAGALSGLRLVLDCANGAASAIAPRVMRELGADVVPLHCSPDGMNINERCGATDTADLAAAVVAGRADAGLAYDGDADRLIAVDHDGHVVDGDHIIAMMAADLDERGLLAKRAVVVTVMSNLGFHRAMRSRGVSVRVTGVGDRHVLVAMESEGIALGGEQSGHVVRRDLATTGDGILTGILLMELLHRRGTRLADAWRASMTRFPQRLRNVPVGEASAQRPSTVDFDGLPGASGPIGEAVAGAELRLGGAGRVLVRASGTEPVVRIMVEAETDELACEVVDRLAGEVARILDGSP